MSDRHRLSLGPIATPDRLLLGPGPSNAHPTVLEALSRMPIGHLDPLYIELMGEVQELLRYVRFYQRRRAAENNLGARRVTRYATGH